MKYAYACQVCDNEFDVEHGMNDRPEGVECPKCHVWGPKRRLITGGLGFVLKGGGWAQDLYASTKDE